MDIHDVADDLDFATGGRIHLLFDGGFPGSYFSRFDVRMDESQRGILIVQVENYFVARENLIKKLMQEGCRGDMRNQNELALEIAISHCKDLIFLRRDCNLILHLYLLMGKLEELYHTSCYFAREGFGRTHHNGHGLNLDDCELSIFWKSSTWVRQQKMSRSFFKREPGDFVSYLSAPYHWTALVFIFIVKYMLHMSMESLTLINKHFLDNQDCIALIGEFTGTKKEWIISEKNWYRDQAFEVIRRFFCEERYFDPDHSMSLYLDNILKFASEYFPCNTRRVIYSAIEAGIDNFGKIKLYQKQERSMSIPRWTEVIESYEADHELIYSTNIRPVLFLAVKKINAMARYDVVGMSANPTFAVTNFITEAIKACSRISVESFCLEFFMYMDYGEDDDEMEEVDESWTDPNPRDFTQAILACMLIEKKLAQCNYHKNKVCEQAEVIFDLLPGGKESYISLQPPPEDPEAFEYDFVDPMTDMDSQCSRAMSVSHWLSDVTTVVDALFAADLSTEENLTVLFGRSDYVSYRIWELHEQRERNKQKSIVSFISRKRIWKEGCIDNDHSLGLKIQYLNKKDRRQRFEDIKNLIPVGNSICSLEPSLDHFVKKFGLGNLGVESVFDSYSNFQEHERPGGSIFKRRRYELDEFLTVEEACRHFFDAGSLEEAIWDLVGIPRVVILNGNKEKMQGSGSWKYCGVKSVLGDKSVQLGSRVAHVYSGSCHIWKEQKSRGALTQTE